MRVTNVSALQATGHRKLDKEGVNSLTTDTFYRNDLALHSFQLFPVDSEGAEPTMASQATTSFVLPKRMLLLPPTKANPPLLASTHPLPLVIALLPRQRDGRSLSLLVAKNSLLLLHHPIHRLCKQQTLLAAPLVAPILSSQQPRLAPDDKSSTNTKNCSENACSWCCLVYVGLARKTSHCRQLQVCRCPLSQCVFLFG